MLIVWALPWATTLRCDRNADGVPVRGGDFLDQSNRMAHWQRLWLGLAFVVERAPEADPWTGFRLARDPFPTP